MLQSIHAEIVRQALGRHVSRGALRIILRSNLGQDDLRGQFGHDEFHFDNNAFAHSRAYLDEQRGLTLAALPAGDAPAAQAAFGRLTHTAQDFYAHTNYVDLWRAAHPESAPADIDPVDPRLLASPDLRSGKLYYPLEVLYFIPGLRRLALSLLPRDSHAHMNLDSAERGPNFEYAFAAAVKRTEWEFGQVRSGLSDEELVVFTGKLNREGAKSAKSNSVDASRPAYALRLTSHAFINPHAA